MNRRVIVIAHVVAVVALLLLAAGLLYWQHPASAHAAPAQQTTGHSADADGRR